MDLLATVAVLSGAAVGLAAIAITVLAWRGSQAVPVLLYEMLHRQGGEVARFALASEGRSFGVAMQECAACQAKARCRAWLDSGDGESFEAFCPNAGYVTRMRGLAARR
jgi:hypothetical protein